MHVAHLIARLNDGGPARIIAALAADLQRHGDRVRVLHGTTHSHEDDLAPRLAAMGIPMHPIPALAPRIDPLADAQALLGILHALRRDPPDLLHCHTAKAGLLGRLAARLLGIRCLHSYHGHVLRGYFPARFSRLLLHCERLCAAVSDNHALDPVQARELCHRWRIGRADRWHVLGNPQPPVQTRAADWHAQLDPARPVICFLGRLTAIKDLPLFLRTCDRIDAARPIQALICGDGDRRWLVERLAARRSYPVHMPGFVPAEEALQVADLLLLSSRNEGQPLAVLEALSAGVPVVCTAVGGLRTWRAHPALSCRARDPEQLAVACLSLLDDPGHRRRQVDAGRRLADSHRPELLLPRYRTLYKRMLRC